MPNEDYTMRTLNLKGFKIINVAEDTITVGLPRKAHICPNCRTVTNKVHDYRLQKIKHLTAPHSTQTIILRKRRYVCSCCNKHFYENNPLLPRYSSISITLKKHVLYCASELLNTKQIARMCKLSSSTVTRIIDLVAAPKAEDFPGVVSVDEFKGNTGGNKFHCIMTDPLKKKIIDVLPNRNSEDIYARLGNTPLQNRLKVKYVTMDMSGQFHSIMTRCFPNAKIIVDKFHVVRLANRAMEHVRKQEQKLFTKYRRRYFKKSRFILLKRRHKLNKDERIQLTNMLNISARLKKAYILKELFYKVMDSKNEKQFYTRISKWLFLAETYSIPKFFTFAKTVRQWLQPLRHAVLTGYSNGYTEGCNNRIKVLKRICFGFRNFERFRNRLMFIANTKKRQDILPLTLDIV